MIMSNEYSQNQDEYFQFTKEENDFQKRQNGSNAP